MQDYKFSIYDPVVDAKREVIMTKEQAESYVRSAQDVSKKLKELERQGE